MAVVALAGEIPLEGIAMRVRSILGSVVLVVALVVGGIVVTSCMEKAQLPVSAGIGPNPQLPEPEHSMVPTVNIAAAKGWPAAEMGPMAASGLRVTAFAAGLDHPRNVFVLPNGDVLAVETNTPPKPDDNKGVRGV